MKTKLLSILTIGLFTLLLGTHVSAADVTVQKGDTLWKISQAHKVTVDDIKKWNNLSSTIIRPGDTLTVTGETKKEVTSAAVKNEKEVVKELKMKATAYTAKCKGCSGITATGINLLKNPNKKVISVDPSVIPLGTEVYVEGYGYAVAGDKGSSIKGNKIDLHYPTRQEALHFGVKTVNVKVLK